MSGLITRTLNGIFRSRWGVAVVLGGIILAVVGVGRLFSDGTASPPLGNSSPATDISINPSDNDSVATSDPPPTPKTAPGRAQPEAVAYAFASAWIDNSDVTAKKWLSRLQPNATPRLTEQLRGVDPTAVPADRVVGKPTLVAVSDSLVNATVTMDNGKLGLRMVAPDGTWLVDGIDWTPA